MKPTSSVATAKNLLIGAGAYYVAGWLGVPLGFGFGKLTQGLIYRGDFNGAVVAPLVIYLPWAIVATAAGATVVWLAESDHPFRWALFPALLFGLFGFLGHHWERPPMVVDRVAQTIGALFPAVACVVGALVAERRRVNLHSVETKS